MSSQYSPGRWACFHRARNERRYRDTPRMPAGFIGHFLSRCHRLIRWRTNGRSRGPRRARFIGGLVITFIITIRPHVMAPVGADGDVGSCRGRREPALALHWRHRFRIWCQAQSNAMPYSCRAMRCVGRSSVLPMHFQAKTCAPSRREC